MSERTLKKLAVPVLLGLSATLLYGGYRVHREVDRRDDYERAVREKAQLVSYSVCEEMTPGKIRQAGAFRRPLNFLRMCSEER